jgi:hypothetical protein
MGLRYRISHDETVIAFPGLRSDPWMQQIPCRYGMMYAHDGASLILETTKRIATAILEAVPGIVVHREADDGTDIRFDIKLFDQVAAIARPHRRRRLSAEHRQARRKGGAATRFST